MGLFDNLDVSASGMDAYRAWMDSTATNIANSQTTRTPEGGPYRRQVMSFEQTLAEPTLGQPAVGGGVRVAAITPDPSDFPMVHDPGHPDADPQGFVKLPNINPVEEMVNLSAASRAYEANISAFNASKMMYQKALEIGK